MIRLNLYTAFLWGARWSFG